MSNWKTYKRVHLGELPNEPGVYVIYHDKELVYIGQSEALRQRLLHHEKISDLTPHLVTVKVRLCSRRSFHWLTLEARLIHRLKPRLNKEYLNRSKLQGKAVPVAKKKRTEGNMPLKDVTIKVMDLYDQGFNFAHIATVLTKQGIEDALGDWWTKDSVSRLVKDELKRLSFGSGRYEVRSSPKYIV